ncbi:hypothetical protein ACPA0O_04610 [Ectopseudomonas chengduensis]
MKKAQWLMPLRLFSAPSHFRSEECGENLLIGMMPLAENRQFPAFSKRIAAESSPVSVIRWLSCMKDRSEWPALKRCDSPADSITGVQADVA